MKLFSFLQSLIKRKDIWEIFEGNCNGYPIWDIYKNGRYQALSLSFEGAKEKMSNLILRQNIKPKCVKRIEIEK